MTTGVARFAHEAKNLVRRFSLPAATLRHKVSETLRALFSTDEVKLNVHARDVQPHGVQRVLRVSTVRQAGLAGFRGCVL